MKILLSHRYFWPDTSPYATILRSIAKRLAEEGHNVTVFTTQPSYHASEGLTAPKQERIDGFNIIRMPIFRENKKNLALRGLNVLSYAVGLRRHILKTGNYNIVMAATFPPLAAARAACSAAHRTGAKFIYHFMDIHPEVSLYSGQLKDGRIFRALQKFDSKTCQRADALVVLSQDMADTLVSRPGNEGLKPIIMNNFVLEHFEKDSLSETPIPNFPDDKFTLLFAGNIGKFQNLDILIEAAHKLSDNKDIQFWFMGEGAAKENLVKQANHLRDKTIFFLPFAHYSIAQNLMGRAKLNIVSLIPNIYKVAYPSKTASILSQSAPILALIEQDSGLAKMVLKEEIGYIANPRNVESVVSAIDQAYQARDTQDEMSKKIKKLYDKRFAQNKILEEWSALVSKLDPNSKS